MNTNLGDDCDDFPTGTIQKKKILDFNNYVTFKHLFKDTLNFVLEIKKKISHLDMLFHQYCKLSEVSSLISSAI